MLQESPGAASLATMEVQLLASPTLACRQAWSKKKVIPTSGKVLFLLCQRNRYDLPPFAEYMETISFCEIWPNLRPQMEQNCSCCSITFRVKMFTVTPASIPHSIPCSHPSWGSIKVCTSFFVTRGGWERTPVPFLFQRSSSAAELGAECLLMSLLHGITHWVP